jgi:polygalacturonase
MNTHTLALLLAAMIPAAVSRAAAPALPGIPARTFKITDYHGAGDGHADNAAALQAAINAARAAGGGIVELPPGDYLCGPVRLADRIRLQVDAGATLRMLPLDRYPGGTRSPANFISGENLHDIAIGGAGTIDGQGGAWWPIARNQGVKRPRMIALSSCQRILIEQVTLKDSPMFHIAISGAGKTSDVTVRGVTIRANPSTDPEHPSHNTDACDVTGKHILIQDCDVSVGDDNFTCGGGTSDVLIKHCTYGNGHGVSIGSYTMGEIANITVEDCTFNNTECGIRIKSDRGRGGNVHDLTYRNLRMTHVGMPILIYASYMAREPKYRKLNDLTADIAASYPAAPMGPRTPAYHDITFSHIIATTAPGRRAGLVWGLPESPVRHLLLDDVQITADKPFGIYSAQDVRLVNCRIVTPEGVNKLSTANAEVKFK